MENEGLLEGSFDIEFSQAKFGGGSFQQSQGSSKGLPQKFDKGRVSNHKVQIVRSKSGGVIPRRCPKCGRNHISD